jgi:putative transposase
MKYVFILARAVAFHVALMCRVLGVSRSGFYAWRARPVSERDKRESTMRTKVKRVFETSSGRYGSPRVHRELKEEGEVVLRKTVASLMQKEGLVARPKKRFHATTDSQHDDPIAPNLLERKSTRDAKDEVWVTDVTAIWTAEGWLFLAVMLDLFSRRVVGWATAATNDRFLALDAVRMAVAQRRPSPGLVHHSDQGSPYASDDYRAELKRFGIVPSMSRKGDCWDNAVAESFFSTLKTEAFGDGLVPSSHANAFEVLHDYIDGFYNTVRRHSHLDYKSPIEFELRCSGLAAAA